MSIYRRLHLPGGTVFFTVCLAERGSTLLTDEIGRLRVALRQTMAERPFRIEAAVVLPDHLHMIWTLPPGDSDIGTRWGAIKARFTRSLRDEGEGLCRPGFSPAPRLPETLPVVRSGRYAGLKPGLREDKREAAVWQRRFWDHHIRDAADMVAHVRYCWTNPVRHGLAARPVDWPHSSIHRDIREGRVAPEWSGACPEGAFGE